MARTTAVLVQNLLGGDYGPLPDGITLPDLNQYITGANLFVTRVQACAISKGKDLTIDELEYIERCISAHYYCAADPSYKQKTTAGATGGYFGIDGKKLESSRYGQLALLSDTSGCVEAFDKRKVATAFWGGSCPAPGFPPTVH